MGTRRNYCARINNPPRGNSGGGGGRSYGGGGGNDDRGKIISHQHSQEMAITFVDLLLQHDALPLGAKTAKPAARETLISEAVDRYTVKFDNDLYSRAPFNADAAVAADNDEPAANDDFVDEPEAARLTSVTGGRTSTWHSPRSYATLYAVLRRRIRSCASTRSRLRIKRLSRSARSASVAPKTGQSRGFRHLIRDCASTTCPLHTMRPYTKTKD